MYVILLLSSLVVSKERISSSHCNRRILLPPGLLLKTGKENRILPLELLETAETLSFTKSALLFWGIRQHSGGDNPFPKCIVVQ